jgi:3-oxoacyl-[acyl-carrier-protein] synthase-3
MAKISYKNLDLKGIAVAVPKNTESNNDYPFSSESEKNLFIKTTGIRNRRKSVDKLCSDLCYEAAERLIEQIKWEKSEISILIYVSQSRDYILPSTSIILQERLGLSKDCICFDVPLGCSGYVYGLSILAAYMSSGQIKKGLLLAGDTSSFTVNPKDKSTYPLFGDAGSATAIEWNANGIGSWDFELGSDGSGSDYIIIPGGHCKQPIKEDSFKEKQFSPGIIRHSQNLKLVGEEIFYFSVTQIPDSVKGILNNSNLSLEDIDYWFMHQANQLMNETIRIKMKVGKDKVPYSLENFGNTSSASIPLTMLVTANELNDNYRFKKILMSGFGVGLSWGNLILDTQDLTLIDLIEL